ncbi:hypothetical protein DFH08DRAFT_243778 [Mycena albidolilacea]|uniref:Uncharacterized protein n=1 Tax=Mycena albidolilacea TaxID=1033008 RepID=A0AAD6ZUU3_9AGAR|nr:hypothetical protein DFH08DRAFT_243778 [Mycena albidolilacea]
MMAGPGHPDGKGTLWMMVGPGSTLVIGQTSLVIGKTLPFRSSRTLTQFPGSVKRALYSLVLINIFATSTTGPPEGFLFLCPPEDFEIEPSSFGWPDYSAYWSLDP